MTPETAALRKRAPTLYAIIAIKLVKGLSLLFLALGVYKLSNENLPAAFRTFLEWLHLDPESKVFTGFVTWVSTITRANVLWVAGGVLLYGLLSLVEAIGLMFRAWWAGWLVIGESAVFIPIEVRELMTGYSPVVLGILALNVLICGYVFQNRHRLFWRHYHHE
jgi:uncharacterized membrane protein (DUF2068 family)